MTKYINWRNQNLNTDELIRKIDNLTAKDLMAVQTLDISNNNIDSLENVVFPNVIEYLYLDNNKIVSLERVVFPDDLIGLFLFNNKINSIDNILFPKNLKELVLYHNEITELKSIIFPQKLDLLDLLLCASYSSPPLRQMRSPLHINFFA